MLETRYDAFFEVAKLLSFSKAAEAMYISQPAVSKHIKKLEQELGSALFSRRGNSIDLTETGKKLLTYMYQVKSIELKVRTDIDIIKNQKYARGELRVGASTTISLYVLPKVLSSFRKKFPNIKLLLINRNSDNIVKALLDKEIDVAIIEGNHEIPAVNFEPYMKDDIIPVCSVHSLFHMESIPLDRLKGLPLVFRERGSGTLKVLSQVLEREGIKIATLNIIARLGGTEALKNYLLEDVAIGFLSRLAIVDELNNGQLKEVVIPGLRIERYFNFVMRRGEEKIGIVRDFINEAKRYYN